MRRSVSDGALDKMLDSAPSKSSLKTTREFQFLILDCSFVTGMDGNAIAGLVKLQVIMVLLCMTCRRYSLLCLYL